MSVLPSKPIYRIGFVVVIISSIVTISLVQLYFVSAMALHPRQTTTITIVSGSANPQSPTYPDTLQTFIPKKVNVQLGINNLVVWKNDDLSVHYVTPEKPYTDPHSGKWGSGAIFQSKSYSFLFTQEGNFPYYCIVHPWMNGEITVSKA